AMDHAVDAHLPRHREMDPDVVEERARRPREVVAVVGQPAERPLAGVEHIAPRVGLRLVQLPGDQGAQLAIEGATESIPASPSLLNSRRFLRRTRVFQRGVDPKRSWIKSALTA